MTELIEKIWQTFGNSAVIIVGLILILNTLKKYVVNLIDKTIKERDEYKEELQAAHENFNNYLQTSNLQNLEIISKFSSTNEALNKTITMSMTAYDNALNVITDLHAYCSINNIRKTKEQGTGF